MELLEMGADQSVKDNEGKQAIHLLAARPEEENGNLELMNTFL